VAVQDLIDQALRESGHRVLTTKNPLEALEVVRRVRIDVLVVGRLPENGQSLFGEFRSIQPGMRIVGISGPDGDLDAIDHDTRLSSPLSLDDLRQAADAVVDSLREG
jgi:DNA-binding NtrC family response regulator